MHYFWRAGAYVGRIQPMRFGKLAQSAIPFGTSTRADFDGQVSGFESSVQRPAGRVDGCRILERKLSLGLHLWMAECLSRHRAFFAVARLASQRKIADSVP